MPRAALLLRIAFSIACGIACVTLAVLWLQSHRFWNSVFLPGQDYALQANSLKGHVSLYAIRRASPTSQFVPAKVSHVPIGGRWAHLFDENVLGFYLGRDRGGLRVDVPHWFAIVAVMAIGCIPWWIKSWRFSLRTLIIATTLLALLLGGAAWTLQSLPYRNDGTAATP